LGAKVEEKKQLQTKLMASKQRDAAMREGIANMKENSSIALMKQLHEKEIQDLEQKFISRKKKKNCLPLSRTQWLQGNVMGKLQRIQWRMRTPPQGASLRTPGEANHSSQRNWNT